MNIALRYFILVLAVLGGLMLAPAGRCLTPAPDGGYAGGNTAEGQNALLTLSSGTYNTAVGLISLESTTTGNFNTGIGAGTLLLNTGDSNTAIGAAALLSNVTGTDNTADGAFALFFNTATGNTALGSKALFNNTTGGALESINGLDLGPNVAIGMGALESNTVSSANTAVGYQALHSFTSGIAGFPQLGLNTAVGFQALANTNGANGGSRNSGFGYQALFHNTDGFSNVAIGDQALFGNETGSRNTAIGFGAGSDVTTASNVICIGYSVGGDNIDNSCFIGNIFSVPIAGTPVVVGQTGQLGTAASSRRFKTAIQPMDTASEALFSLKPVAFRYKKDIDPKGTRQLGLVAEEVEKVDPNLVIHDKEGKPFTVRYEQVNAMLLNEFLKEHKKVEQLQAALEAINKRLKEQDAKIEKVDARVEVNGTALRRVANR
jgi:hypothetical protein